MGKAPAGGARHRRHREPGRCVRHLGTAVRAAGGAQVRVTDGRDAHRWSLHAWNLHQPDPGLLFGHQ